MRILYFKADMNTNTLLEKLLSGKDLHEEEVRAILGAIVRQETNASQIAAFLTGMKMKGESVSEIVGLIKGMRKHMIPIGTTGTVIDTCGTGGDGKGTFNISTAVALIVAAAGVRVAKHGNRAASSICGSADVLEALGVNLMLKPEQAKKVLERVGMVFLFAPLYHPVMKHIAPVRKELGFRTVFNYLGPFLNPVNVRRQLIGVPDRKIAKKLAQVAKRLGYDHLLIVSGEDGMDEISTAAKTYVFEVKKRTVSESIFDPVKFGIKKANPADLVGGSAKQNAAIIQDVLSGKKGPKRDIVLLNTAFALYSAGRIENIREGISLAGEAIDSGRAASILSQLVEKTQKYA